MSYGHPFPRAVGNTFTPNVAMNVIAGQPTSQPLNVIPTGTTVLAHYHEYAWYFGLVQNYNLTRNGTLVYQILFRSGEIRSVASAQVLSQQSNNQNIEVGSRVVVQHPTKSMFISSLIGELPCVENMFRYLLFLDDGSACYKTKDKLWVINLVENPILMLPTAYKSFIQRYFMMSGQSVKCLNMNINDILMFTNFDNMTLQFTGKVIQIDCSIALIQYTLSNGSLVEEWIHRGSNRILSLSQSPLLFQNSNTHVNGTKNSADVPSNSNDLSINIQSNMLSTVPSVPTIQKESLSNSSKHYVKSPLKSKQYMVPPTYDPFMFSDDEEPKMKSAKPHQFHSWSVEHNQNLEHSRAQVSAGHVTVPSIPNSPIIVLDDTPEKKEMCNAHEPLAYNAMPKPDFTSTGSSIFQNNSVASNESFLSQTSVTENDSPLQKQSSVFSWSAPVESDTRRCLKLSPKINSDVDFDFGDTILNTPTSTHPATINQNNKNMSLINDEIIVLDDDDPILVNNIPSSSSLTNSSNDNILANTSQPDTNSAVKIEITKTPSTPSLPMILHQETCDITEEAAMAVDTIQSGKTIEVLVGCNNGKTVISVAPTIEIVSDPIVIKSESPPLKISSPNSLITAYPRKRRFISPLKSPVSAIPKLKINLRNIIDASYNNSSKDLTFAAQKCVKRARKQQSKESVKNHILAEKKKKKIVNASVKCAPLIQKREPIKLNSDAKIARWVSPWSKLISKKGIGYVQHEDSTCPKLFSQVLQKVQVFDIDEELEEGEIDESDGELDDDTMLPYVLDHTDAPIVEHECSFLCNKFNSDSTKVDSPFLLPLQYGWKRMSIENYIIYVSPCNKNFDNINLVHTHLIKTKCTFLNKDNFCFDPDISLEICTPNLDFVPLFTDNDLSNGMENVPVPFVSNIGPIIKYNFHYIIDSLMDFKIIEDANCSLHSCDCEDKCYDACPCIRAEGNIKTECNHTCKCSINCNNRQSQRSLQHKLQIVQKDTKFHVIALHDIPANTFICSLVGVVKRTCEISDFVFPLSSEVFNEPQLTDNALIVQKATMSKFECTKNSYHEDSCLILSSDLELIQKRIDSKLSRFQIFNQYWAKVALKHNRTESIMNNTMPLIYPSINVYRDAKTRSKRYSASTDDIAKKPPIDLYLDCTEFGNIGRFIRIGDNHNLVIKPVYVDSNSMPWLALYSSCKIFSLSELIIKPFNR